MIRGKPEFVRRLCGRRVTTGCCGWCVSSLQSGVPTRLLPSTKTGPLRIFYQVPKCGLYASSTKYQNGSSTRLLPSTKMGSLRVFYQYQNGAPTRLLTVPKWCSYASSTKYQNGAPTRLLPCTKMGLLRFFYQVPKWVPTRLLPSTEMGLLRFFYQVPKWGSYDSSTKYQNGVPKRLLPSTKMGSPSVFSPLAKCASPQLAGRSCKLVTNKTNIQSSPHGLQRW